MIFATPTVGPEEQAALDKIDVLRRDLRYYVAEPRRWMGPVRRILAARAIQGSNSIEGYDVSVEDAVAAVEGLEPTEAADITWSAVTGYRRAMTYVLQLANDDHFSYSPELLKSLHFMMTDYSLDVSPGLWRPGPIWVRNDETGDVVYEAPQAETVPGLVDELVLQLSDETDGPAFIRGSMAHLNLVMIHPFRDGNGRMARALQTLVLAREGILAPELSSIEEYLGRNTARYYQALADVGEGSWKPSNDARPWIRFCLEAHFIQAASVLRRVNESEQVVADIEALIASHGVPDRSIAALFDAALGMRVRNPSYRAAVEGWEGETLSEQVATKDLGTLVKAGLLKKHGAKRGSYYVASRPLVEARDRVRASRQPLSSKGLFTIDQSQLFD